jgi:L-rhamnose mutarotase
MRNKPDKVEEYIANHGEITEGNVLALLTMLDIKKYEDEKTVE